MARLGRYISIGDQAVSSISNFAAVAITANVASAGQFGQFSLAYAALLLFLGAQRALLGETLLVKYSADGAVDAGVRRGVMGGSLMMSAAALPLLLAGAVLADESSRLLWFVLAASLPVVLLQDTLRYLFICEGAPGRALAIDLMWAVLAIGSMALAAMTTQPVWVVVLCWGAGAAGSLCLGLGFSRALPSLRGGRRWLGANRDPGLRYLGEFSALSASTFIVIYLLVVPLGATGVGALRAAQLLFSPLNTGFAAIKMAVVPELVRSKGTAAFRRRMAETFVVVAVLAAVWGLAVMFIPDPIGALLLGETWEAASDLRLAYFAQYLAMVPYTVLLAYCRSVRADRLSTLMRAALAVLTLVLPLTFAVAGGVLAAAWAFAVAVAVAAGVGVIGNAVSRKKPRSTAEPRSGTGSGVTIRLGVERL